MTDYPMSFIVRRVRICKKIVKSVSEQLQSVSESRESVAESPQSVLRGAEKTSGESAPRIFFRLRPMIGQEKHSPPLHPAMGISGQTDARQEIASDGPTDSANTATLINLH